MKHYQFIFYQQSDCLSSDSLKSNHKQITSIFAPCGLQSYCKEFLRPWKLLTFMLGLSFLLYGAWAWNYMDWNWLNSIVMALLTYWLAPWTTRVLWQSWVNKKINYKSLLALVAWVGTVDTSYTLSNWIVHYPVFHLANFPASTMLFFGCGLLWSYQGTLAGLIYDLRHIKEIESPDYDK